MEATLAAVVPAGLYSSSYLQFGRCASVPQRRAYFALSFEASIFAHSFEISALPKGMSEPDFGLSGGIVMSTGNALAYAGRSPQAVFAHEMRDARCRIRDRRHVQHRVPSDYGLRLRRSQ